MQTIGISKDVKTIFHMLDEDQKLAITRFCSSQNDKKFKDLENEELLSINNNLSTEEQELLKLYTGYHFREINNILRDRWNYNENGKLENKQEFQLIAEELKEIIENQQSLGNIKSYRGVTIDYFYPYGIYDIKDLNLLVGNYLMDRGFVSTSLKEEKCFFKKENELGNNYNIKIIYNIPSEFTDGIYLGKENLSYNPEQQEYLINSWNLAKVMNVEINNNSAIITTLLIPKKVYDDYYISKEERNHRI